MVTPGIEQRGEEKHETEGGQQITKPKAKLMEKMSESVLPVGSSGESASAGISTSNRLRGVQSTYVNVSVCAPLSNSSPAQRGSLISPRKMFGRTDMISPPAPPLKDIHP